MILMEKAEILRLIDIHLGECPHDNCILNVIRDRIEASKLD